MTRRLIPASCYESLVLSEAEVGGVRWDYEVGEDIPSVCRGCMWDLDAFAKGETNARFTPIHGRPATVAEVVHELGERGR